MAILTVGPTSTFPTIAAAMIAAGPGDTIQLETGYSNETATVTHNGMIVSGGATSTGIVLQLGTGIATFSLAGTAPINVLDAPDGNGIVGNDGNNVITVTDGADAVSGGLGIDRLVVDYHLSTLAITGNSTSNFTEAGGSRLVTITSGTFENFTVLTGSGADTITVGDGNNIVNAGDGANTITAGNGANSITGGSGADTITAGDGGNIIDGGAGTNTITSGNGNDVIISGVGADTIIAGGGIDVITVRGGADSVNSGAGNDRLIVDYSAMTSAVIGGVTGGNLGSGYTGHIADSAGNSVDFVETENLTITTGVGNDIITTGDGIDVLGGGAGNDTLTGGGGNDTFVYAPGGDGDTITDFTAGASTPDRIDLTAFGYINRLADVQALATMVGTDTVVNFGNGDILTLQNVAKTDLDVDDFVSMRRLHVDFNGDGKSDLLLLNDTTHGVAVWQMNGTLVEASPQVGTVNAAAGWHYTDAADFNGDGKSDLLLLNDTTHGVAIWQMNGTQVELSPQIGTINAAAGWHYSDVADFNGDGKSDLLLLNDTTHGVAVWQMNGTQIEASPQVGTINAAAGWQYRNVADFNGDGKSDLLLLNDTTHGVAIWQMNGTQVELDPQVGTINAAAGWHFSAVGDFNGDGKSDLLLLNDTTHGVAIWQMNGTQVELDPQVGTINAAAGWHFSAVGDFNGDGKSDLLLLNDTTHGVAIWQMNGTQVELDPQVGTINAAAGWHFSAVDDFNGDGKSDLLLLNDSTHGVAIWEMNGTQVEQNPQVGMINAAADWHLIL